LTLSYNKYVAALSFWFGYNIQLHFRHNESKNPILLVVKRIMELDTSGGIQTKSSTDVGGDDDDDIDQYIELESSRHATKTPNTAFDEKQLMKRIRELGKQPKLKMKSNIFGYFEQQKKKEKLTTFFFEAVMTNLAAPATQVSAERAFSALALLMDDLRCNLSSATVDSVLVIALNSDLTNDINFSDMNGTL
ncbi:hypothetical protein Bhyg_03502, partial [Pseudolycoriella hygida]